MPDSRTPSNDEDQDFWNRVRALFHETVALQPALRAQFLDTRNPDARVRREVESLLESDEQAVGLFELEPIAAAFSPGDLVAGRYRIVRLLGEGGMGEVFEAVDEELRESVALKIIRAQIASDPTILLRFKREIQLARKVTHPNVCRIFDVSHHVEPLASGGRRIAFISMELLHGETLAERLTRGGRMTEPEALAIVRQLASGLDAAHAAGIVHRDFKSANVMLVPSSGSGAPRAVITDFGLAHDASSEPGTSATNAPITQPGLLIGTPDYMAPEQVEHGSVSAQTDIYAFGVVMFEMLTGRLPFSGKTPAAVALSRLHQAPPSPRDLRRDLNARWDGVILRALARDPRQRFRSGAEIIDTLDGARALPAVPRRPRSPWMLLWLLPLLFIVALPLILRNREKKATVGPHPQPGVVTPRRAIAILGFRNASGKADTSWISDALSEMLANDLEAGDQLRTVAPEEVLRLRHDLGVSEADALTPAATARIRSRLGAELILSGSYVALDSSPGSKVQLQVRMLDLDGNHGLTFSESGDQSDLVELTGRGAARVRSALGIEEPTKTEVEGTRAAIADGTDVIRLYTEGLGQLRRYDSVTARATLEHAIEKDPTYPLAHVALSQALTNTGFERAASEEAKKAFDLSTHLRRSERLEIEGRYRELGRQWPEAIEIYRSLVTFYPDDLSYRLRLAEVQAGAGKAKDSLATIDAARRLPAPLRDDPRLDIAEADASRLATDYKRELDAAVRAENKGLAFGEQLVVARAAMSHGFALRDAGKLDEALAKMRQAETIYAEAGDMGGAAKALSHQGLYLNGKGDLKEARAAFEKALVIQRAVGNRSQEARTLSNMGNVFVALGDMLQGEKSYEAALRAAREVDNRSIIAPVLGNLGAIQQLTGNLPQALKYYAEQTAVSHTTDDKFGELVSMINTSEVLRLEGKLNESQRAYEQSLAEARSIGQKENEAYVLSGMALLALQRGDLSSARKRATEALTMQDASGYKTAASDTRGYLSSIYIEEGKLAEAERLLPAAVAELKRESAKENEAAVHEVFARLRLAQGRPDQAAVEIETAIKLAAGTLQNLLDVTVRMTHARVLLAQGARGAATNELQSAMAAARKGSLAGSQLEGRLLEAQMLRDQGPRESALRAVAQDAHAAGFLTIERHAN